MLGNSLLRLHTGLGRRVKSAKSANFSPVCAFGAHVAVVGGEGTSVRRGQVGWWLVLSLFPGLL